ncbi:glycosyltransferase family 2 protein [Sansalvadorimonas verongulae]|uniref:glycosyltransferase family 2 protein n=1 Tax=Sansalvadorimonas verongulae TaxID=2172824 RepID=UPI0012BC7DD3|nr:glycosyltransferase family 2 protein [Sansalvadorimonas verongulae]MTI12042.1 glycosyltransferase family 2 protein [Sansalvadorimonas verongulae]
MTDKKPLFSIVIPAYNYAQTLPRALKSALKQEGDDYEILVINDGSTDNTVDILEELQIQYPNRFEFVTRENAGAAATRNYGIKNTTGEWLLFLDSDDEFTINALVKLRDSINNAPEAKMIVGGHIAVEPNGKERYRGVDAVKSMQMTQEELFVAYLIKKDVTPSNGATAMHRDIFSKKIYPEEFRNSEDIPVFANAFANHTCAFLDQAITKIHKHPDSLRHNTEYADAVGTRLVNSVFDDLPKALEKYKKSFASQRCLSLFRTYYLSGEKSKALGYYKKAISQDWLAVTKLSYTKKAIRLIFG